MNSGFHQSHPFSNLGLRLWEQISSQKEQILTLREVPDCVKMFSLFGDFTWISAITIMYVRIL